MKKLYTLVGILCLASTLHAQFQWEHTGGPEGMGTCTPYYNKDFAFLYDNFTLFRTGDGQSWEVINSTQAGSIVVSDERISIYTEQHMGVDQPKQIQFQLSKDNGETWSNAAVPSDAYYNFNQVMLCSHGIYFKAGEKLYRSQTDGQSWKQVSYDSIAFTSLFASDDRVFGRNGDQVYEFIPQSGKWVYAWNMPVPDGILEAIYIRDLNIIIKTGNIFYSSLNKGEVWITFATQTNQISHFIEKDNQVYFQSGNYIRYTDNGGYSWKSILLNGLYRNMTLIKDKLLLISDKDGCFLFDDSGNSYMPANKGLHSPGIWNLWAGGNVVWAQLFSDNSLYKYDTFSGEWSHSGLPKATFNSFPFLISASGFFLYDKINSEEILISTNQSTDWDTLNTPFSNPNNLESYFWIGDYIYVQGNFGQKYISKDLGVTWHTITRVLNSGVVFKDQIWAIEYNGRLLVSNDDANSWEQVVNKPDGIKSIYEAEDRLFLVTVTANQTFLYSSVNGYDWEFSGDGLGINEIRPGYNDIVKIKKFNGIYYLQTERSYLFYSEDNGRSWERILNLYYEAMTLLNDTVYVGNYNGGGVRKSPLPRLGRQMARGSIFHDINGNGLKDTDERYLSDVQMMLSTVDIPQKNYFTLSNQDGQFEIRPSYGLNDTLRPNLFSEYIENIEPPFYLTHDSINSFDFAVRYRPDITDANISGTYNRQPGSGKDINIHLQYQNIGTVPFSGVVSLKMDPAFNFIQSTPPPSSINNDSLIWQFEDLAVLDKKQILVEGKLSFFLETDSLIRSFAQIFPDRADENLSDNFTIIEDKVSINANTLYRKRVNPEGMTEAEMREGKDLEYTIYFQNPSNVEVKDFQISDMLAAELDIKTIRIIGSSHTITKWELLPSRILRVHFQNAYLPPANPSAYEVQGFFKFGIRIRKDINPNFNIQNIASIVFDARAVGYTNFVQTRWTAEVTTGMNEVAEEVFKKLSIYPNPASQNCYLSTNGRMKGAGIVRVFNARGQVLFSREVHELSMDIELQTDQLSNGFYLITAEGAEGIMHGKLIIQK